MSCSYLGMPCLYIGMACLYLGMACLYLGMACLIISMSWFQLEPSMMSCDCFSDGMHRCQWWSHLRVMACILINESKTFWFSTMSCFAFNGATQMACYMRGMAWFAVDDLGSSTKHQKSMPSPSPIEGWACSLLRCHACGISCAIMACLLVSS